MISMTPIRYMTWGAWGWLILVMCGGAVFAGQAIYGSPGGFITLVLLCFPAGIMGFIAFVLALIRSAQAEHWDWFASLCVGLVLGLGLFVLAAFVIDSNVSGWEFRAPNLSRPPAPLPQLRPAPATMPFTAPPYGQPTSYAPPQPYYPPPRNPQASYPSSAPYPPPAAYPPPRPEIFTNPWTSAPQSRAPVEPPAERPEIFTNPWAPARQAPTQPDAPPGAPPDSGSPSA